MWGLLLTCQQASLLELWFSSQGAWRRGVRDLVDLAPQGLVLGCQAQIWLDIHDWIFPESNTFHHYAKHSWLSDAFGYSHSMLENNSVRICFSNKITGPKKFHQASYITMGSTHRGPTVPSLPGWACCSALGFRNPRGNHFSMSPYSSNIRRGSTGWAGHTHLLKASIYRMKTLNSRLSLVAKQCLSNYTATNKCRKEIIFVP